MRVLERGDAMPNQAMTNGQRLEELKVAARARALTDRELQELLDFHVAAVEDGAIFIDSKFDDSAEKGGQ